MPRSTEPEPPVWYQETLSMVPSSGMAQGIAYRLAPVPSPVNTAVSPSGVLAQLRGTQQLSSEPHVAPPAHSVGHGHVPSGPHWLHAWMPHSAPPSVAVVMYLACSETA